MLGCFLIRRIGRRQIIGKIIETEAYCGPKDLANHASKGLTKRTAVMFGSAGHAYIYLIYGMYYCFNVVTEKQGYPAAVLIRGVKLISNSEFRILNKSFKIKNSIIGPGKVCRELKIDKQFNGIDLTKSPDLYIIDHAGGGFSRRRRVSDDFSRRKLIKKLPRVGVNYAGVWAKKKWRFVLKEER